MKTIVLATQKGGAGKSTLTRNLAVQACKEGRKVAILDLDPQGTTAAWWGAREADDIELVTLPAASQIPAAQEALAGEGVDYLFIDTPGKNDPGLDHALRAATLVVVPVQPSPDDLRAIGQTLAAVDGAGRPYVFVMSRTVRSRLLEDAIRAVAAQGRVAPINIASRVVYPETAADGTAAPEASDTKAAAEIAALWAYVEEKAQ